MQNTQLHPTRWRAPSWYEINPARLVLEKKAMEMRFPSFRLARNEQDELLWRGVLETNKSNRYQVALIYPDIFPAAPPKVYPIEPPITVWKDEEAGLLKHQFRDGRLCLYYPGDRSFDQNTTAATVMAVAAAWLFAYESWLDSGKTVWPGIEVD